MIELSMNLLQHFESRDLFVAQSVAAEQSLKQLTDDLISLTHPLPGTYMVFQHNTATLIRLRQIAFIVRRLYDDRAELFRVETASGSNSLPEASPPAGYVKPPRSRHELDEQIVLDFQTFLLFAGIALDEWAHCAAYVLGIPNPTKSSFDRIAKDGRKELFREVWDLHQEGILWLDTFIRLFRNKFVVHREHPWQFSYGHLVNSLEWSFWSPLSIGWITEKKEAEVTAEISVLLTKLGVAPSSDGLHRQVLQVLRRVSELDESDRKIIRNIAAEVAFEMPTFQEIAHRLIDFFIKATKTLSDLADTRPERINLGFPPK